MAKLLAITSDHHAGSTIGLCPPKIDLDDGGSYQSSKLQLWIWDWWQRYWDEADRLRAKYKADLLAEFNGDITEGNHHGTTQILSGNPTAQAAVVDACMAVPLSLKPEHMVFVRGTEAHVGKSACYEERIALGLWKDDRPVIRDEDTGTASHWQWRAEIEGVRFDFAHHGRLGTRPWTKGNVTMNLAAEIFYEHAADGEPHPHVAVRSHLHRYFDTGDAHPVRVIQTPAWQARTAFTFRIASENMADIGGIFLLVDDGNVERIKFIQKTKRSTVWVG